jgi:hypothetical protein
LVFFLSLTEKNLKQTLDKIFSIFLLIQHLLRVHANLVQLLLDDSLDTTLQKYIVDAYSSLNTIKIIDK